MDKTITYIIVFILFAVIGWIYEYHFFGKDAPDRVSSKFLNVNLPILPIYGVGGVLLYYITTNYIHLSILHRTIIATIIITIFECVAGQVSFLLNRFNTWSYADHQMSTCSGYISLETSLWWAFLIYIGFYISDKFTLSRK